MKPRFLAVLLSLVVLPVSIFSAAAGAAHPSTDATNASRELLAFADELHVSSADLHSHMLCQDALADALPPLESAPGVQGVWMRGPTSPCEFVIAVASPSIIPSVLRLVPDELRPRASFIERTVSEAQLRSTASSIRDELVAIGEPHHVHVDLVEGHLDVHIASSSLPKQLRSSTGTVPVRTYAESPMVTLPAFHGGQAMSSCTSGFTVMTTSAPTTRGVSTAGHCANAQSIGGTSLVFKREFYSGHRDLQWHTKAGATFTNQVWTGSTTYRVTKYQYRDKLVVGGFYCKFGKTTGGSCGQLTSKSEPAPPYVPKGSGAWLALDRLSGGFCAPGDSGGPIFSFGTATGTISGCAGGTRVVGMQLAAFVGTGVTIATS